MSAQSPRPFIPAAEALPAIIEILPPDSEFSGQLRFARGRQADFLRKLADCGEVRAAAKASAVSHQTVYRMRRASPAFRAGMDAAMLIARELAEDLLASRAMNGIEEEVYYHGEVVATRRRYSDRLLLAHLARLDRLAERDDLAVVAGSFDELIEAFETAEDESEEALSDFAPGPCNMRSTSCASSEEDEAETPLGEEVEEVEELPVERLEERLCAMEDARPADAPPLSELAQTSDEIGEIEALHLAAFEAGEAEWWMLTKTGAEAGADGKSESGFRDSEERRILKAP